MKSIRREAIWCVMLFVIMAVLVLSLGTFRQTARYDNTAMAAVTNPSPASPGYFVIVLTMPSNYAASVSNIARFKMPWPATLVGASAVVRTFTALGSASIDITEADTSVLSSQISLASSTITEGVISDSAIADEATIGITLTIASGTFTDPTVQLNFKRL